MSYEFKLVHRSLTGEVKRQAITDFLWLSYSKKIRAAGTLRFMLNGDHPSANELEEFDQFEVWWRNRTLDVPWYRDFIGIYREPDWTDDEDNVTSLQITCPEDKSILGWRQIAWHAGVDNRSRFTGVPAETAMKTLVTYNCTAAASVGNGRLRNGNLADSMGITIVVENDLGRGNLVSRSFANGNLLRVLSETLAPIAGGDFSLTRTGPATWRFTFHPGQLGEDKRTGSNRVEFSKVRDNMVKARFRRRPAQATVAIVGGQGEGVDRAYDVVEGDDYAPGYDIEMFVDARNEANDGLEDAGAAKLKEVRLIKALDFEVKQTSSVFYGPPVSGAQTYLLGDLVRAIHRDEEFDRQVTGVAVSVQVPGNSSETSIDIETEDILQ